MLDNKQHRTAIPEGRETSYPRPMNECLRFLPQSTFHTVAKKENPSRAVQELKYDFQKPVAGVISGASCVFTKLSYTCTG